MFSNTEVSKSVFDISLYITLVKFEHTSSYGWFTSINEISSIKISNNSFIFSAVDKRWENDMSVLLNINVGGIKSGIAMSNTIVSTYLSGYK